MGRLPSPGLLRTDMEWRECSPGELFPLHVCTALDAEGPEGEAWPLLTSTQRPTLTMSRSQALNKENAPIHGVGQVVGSCFCWCFVCLCLSRWLGRTKKDLVPNRSGSGLKPGGSHSKESHREPELTETHKQKYRHAKPHKHTQSEDNQRWPPHLDRLGIQWHLTDFWHWTSDLVRPLLCVQRDGALTRLNSRGDRQVTF